MKVLICVDYGKAGEIVLKEAQTFLKALPEAEIHVYSVIDLAQVANGSGYNAFQADMDTLSESCKKLFHGREINFHSEQGYPADKIAQYAQMLKCDLLIMGTHGRTGMNHFMTGSVAEKVLRNVNCNTLIIPVKSKI